jgi:hypothetical protein
MSDFEISFVFATGEDAAFEIEIDDEAGTDLSGNSFEYCLYDGAGLTVFSLSNGSIPRSTGAIVIVIPRATTSGMSVGAAYSHSLWMMDGSYRRLVGSGSVTVTQGRPV